MNKYNGRFTDPLHFVKVDPVVEQQLAEGKAAALRGEPADATKPDPWRRGHQIGQYELEARLADAARERSDNS